MANSLEKIKKSIAEQEEEILRFWAENKIFEKTLEKNSSGESFVFYDGPPFATGLPHYGHLLAGTIKDVIPRYETMKGKYVRRRWGWDCHGLPIENIIEKELGLKNKKDIEKLGIDKFNKKAKDSVLRYDSDWKNIVPRMGRWIDMEESYKTMDASYTESIWWAFKTLYDKGLIYEGYKSMHICPRCETTLANSEVTSAYKDITDISITAKFELVDELGTYFLAWTTTPWTLPGNVALAINPEVEYVKIKDTEENFYILAKERLEDVMNDAEYKIVEEILGKDLIGKKYKPVFDYYNNTSLENFKNGFKVYGANFVDTESGTGIVHIAPAFGEDDMEMGKAYELPFIQHVGMDGKFKDEIIDFKGEFVKPKDNHQSADIEIIKNLAKRNLLFSKKKISHSYPHCWRCDTPLLNYAASSWFVKVTALKDRLLEINKGINWIPNHIKDGRFGKWLEGSRDWAISRSRFWGAPIPVWKNKDSEKIEVMGSLGDLKSKIKKSGNKYFVIRHGESDANVAGIVSSKVDNPHYLTDKGKDQARDKISELKSNKIELIIASPFIRTKETAEILAEGLGIKKEDILFEKRIQEFDNGDLDGKSVSEFFDLLKSIDSPEVCCSTKFPNGESITDVKKRMGEFLYEIEERYSNKNILIVTHATPFYMLTLIPEGADAKKTVMVREEGMLPKNGELKELLFVPIPHNENYELDFHRPYIDQITFNKEEGEFLRVPEVFDCWFESGSMPYAQFHYPFENKEEFKKNFPADVIAEGLDQTRGWFYNMLVLSVGLFDKTPYKNVIVNGMVLAEDGQKMAKRLKNYPDPMDTVAKYGADALRYYLLSSPVVRGEDLNFSEKGIDEVYKKIIVRLLNVLSFYKIYEDKDVGASDKSKNVLDKWIVIRLNELMMEIEESMKKYELDKAIKPISLFIDDLSTWYLRRSRDRFKSDNKKEALETMRFVLEEFSKVIAPFMPFISEHIYKEVGGGKESVHLEDYPIYDKKILENDSLKEMEKIRDIVSLALLARMDASIKVRQPLKELRIKSQDFNKELLNLIRDEVNVKEVVFDEKLEKEIELDTEITPELKKEGQVRNLIRYIQDTRKKLKLTSSDYVKLSVETNDKGRILMEEFIEEIKKTSKIESVVFADIDDEEEFAINDLVFKIKLIF